MRASAFQHGPAADPTIPSKAIGPLSAPVRPASPSADLPRQLSDVLRDGGRALPGGRRPSRRRW